MASIAPPYARVKQFLKDGLEQGRWPIGALMPSEAELVQQFGISRMTANRALRELQSEGLVERLQGVGTFAAPLHRLASKLTIRDLHEEIESRGGRYSLLVHLAREEKAPRPLARRLGLAPGAPVWHSVVVHSCDGLALQCEDRYVNPACAPGYLEADFTSTTPTRYLREVAPLWEAEYSIEAGVPTALEARLLTIEPGEPCLIVVRLSRNHEVPITIARFVHPGGRYAIGGSFKP